MKKIFTKEVKIGIVFIIALFVLYYGINFLKGVNIFKKTNTYTVVFDNVTDLSLSSPVLLNGYKVGLVSGMDIIHSKNNEKIAVTINLDQGVNIPVDSKIKLDVSLMGSASVIIDKNPYTTQNYVPTDTLQGIRVAGLMESVGSAVVPQLTELVPKLDSIMSGLQTLVNHPSLIKSLENVETITTEMTSTTQQLNQLMFNLNKDIPQISKNMLTITSDLSTASSQLKTMDLTTAYKAINTSLKNVENLTNKLNSDNSSLGLLLHDRALYDSLNITIGNASKLLEDVKENPSRYINVKVF